MKLGKFKLFWFIVPFFLVGCSVEDIGTLIEYQYKYEIISQYIAYTLIVVIVIFTGIINGIGAFINYIKERKIRMDREMKYSYPQCNRWRRFFAYYLDRFMFALVIYILSIILDFAKEGNPSIILFIVILFLIFICVLWWFLYFCKDGIMQGQSPAKKMLGLMVINVKNNKPCGKRLSFERSLFHVLCDLPHLILLGYIYSESKSSYIPISIIISMAVIVFVINIVEWFSTGRLLHDRAGTMVINKKDYTPNNNLE